MKPFYITSKDKNGSIIVVITPMRVNATEYNKDLYLTSEGNIELVNSDKVVNVSLEEAKKEVVKVEKPKTEAKTEKTTNKVFPRVRGIKTTRGDDKATRKQLSYLYLLTGKRYDENMTIQEASKEITRIKNEREEKLDPVNCDA